MKTRKRLIGEHVCIHTVLRQKQTCLVITHMTCVKWESIAEKLFKPLQFTAQHACDSLSIMLMLMTHHQFITAIVH
jgi:hypothetical protein